MGMRLTLLAVGCSALLMTGCGVGLTRSMWNDPLPDDQPERVGLITLKAVATPLTIALDGTTEVLSHPKFWEAVFNALIRCH